MVFAEVDFFYQRDRPASCRVPVLSNPTGTPSPVLPYHQRMAAIPSSYPGHEIVAGGMEDLKAGRETPESLLVAMAATRLRAIGIDVPNSPCDQPSHRLYELLTEAGPGAHGRYNALVGRMSSFSRAAEHAAAG